MNLQELIKEDLEILFDLDEFATTHLVEGRTVKAVVDNDQLQKNVLQSGGALNESDLLIFVKSDDLDGLLLTTGALLTFDGRPYRVIQLVEEDGVTQLTLSGTQGGY